MRKSRKPLIAGLAIALVAALGIGGTLAWLTAQTQEVKNTFTVGDIDITLTETTGSEYKMIPGWTIDKDPVVTVKADSEDCWVFIEVKESSSLDDYISYTIDPNNWTKLSGEENVYYCKATDVKKDCAIKVLGYGTGEEFVPNKVLVNGTVTKEMMEALSADSAVQPTLTFKAYAVQLYKTNGVEFTAVEAWEKVKPSTTDTTTTK